MQLAAPRNSVETLSDLGLERLRALCEAIGLDPWLPAIVFERLVSPWGLQSTREPPQWPSEVGDDNTPFEFSVAIGASPELRVMVEPLGKAPSLLSNTETAVALIESLSTEYDIDLTRFNRLRDLFLPPAPQGAFAIWIAAEFARARSPQFKVYLNPFAQGVHLAPALIEESLVRLGFNEAWPFIAQVLARRGSDVDELMYLSLDMSKGGEPRVKVYARHRRSTAADLEAAASGSPGHQAGDVTRFIETVAPDIGTFEGRAPFTCYAFVAGQGGRPAAATTHFPINGYASNDEIVRDRVTTYLDQVGLPRGAYRSALTAFATRPLKDGIGIQSYVSIRRHHGQPRATVYLPVEAYRPGTVAKPPRTFPPSGVQETVSRFELGTINHEPFIRRLRREPANELVVRTLARNYERSLSHSFERLSRDLVGRLADADIGEQLRGLMSLDRQVSNDHSRPPKDPTSLLGDADVLPARQLGSAIGELIECDDVYEALGTLIARSIFDGEMTALLAQEFARLHAVDPLQPVGSSAQPSAVRRTALALIRDIPIERLDGTWRGARRFWRSSKAFFGALYALSYSARGV